jgi:acetolactate synthase-1/2/3 large subunit
LPDDLQRMNIDPKKQKKYKIKKKRKENIKNLVKNIYKIIDLLKKSHRPLLVIGNGVKISKSEDLIKKIIKKTNIPFVPTWACVDMFNSDDKLNAGTFGVAATRHGNFAVQNADLLLILGARLSPQLMGSNPLKFSPNSKKVLIDIDKFEFQNHRLPKIDLKINHNVKYVLKKFLEKKISKIKDYNYWISKINYYKKNFPVCLKSNFKNNKFIDPYAFFHELSVSIKDNDIIIPDASANLIWSMQGLKVIKKQKIFTALNHSPMGYSVPASVGAFFANKNKKKNIVTIIGDGSMQMNIQELETIKHYKVNTKIFIINNQGYGLIKQTQDTWLKSYYSGVDKKSGLSLPDFISVAKAYKIKSVQLKHNSNLKRKISNILKIKGPVVIDVVISPKAKVKPKIDFGKPLHDMSPPLKQSLINSIMKF